MLALRPSDNRVQSPPWLWWASVVIIVHAAITWPVWLPRILQLGAAHGLFVYSDATAGKRTTPLSQPLDPVKSEGVACCE